MVFGSAMKINLLKGLYSDTTGDYRTSIPRNYMPVPKQLGSLSGGYLRPAPGVNPLVFFPSAPGVVRGAINWLEKYYCVVGQKLFNVSQAGLITELGEIRGDTTVTIDYSFDRMSIVSDGHLYYFDTQVVTEVTDPDLGHVIDQVWIDGYFVLTDGEFLIVTELNNPNSISSLKYGSSEYDPDPVVAVHKVRNELYAVNRHTVEVFENVGGTGFPFSRIEGGLVTRGAISTKACCVFEDSIAMLGGRRNEPLSVWLASAGTTIKLATREIDVLLEEYTTEDLIDVLLETRNDRGHQTLYVHLPDRTLVYDLAASKAVQMPVWFELTTGLEQHGQYKARHMTLAYGQWYVGHTDFAWVGAFTEDHSLQWLQRCSWEFGTEMLYNEGQGALVHEVELVGLPGAMPLGPDVDARIALQWSEDGLIFSQPKTIKLEARGGRSQRLIWRQQGRMRASRILKFSGDSWSRVSFARVNARLEPLSV